jgi:hypothetical protein
MPDTLHRPPKAACRTCQWTRYFLLVAAVLVMGLWGGAGFELPSGWDYSAVAGDLFLGLFVLVLALKWWVWARDRRSREAHDDLTWLGQSRRPAPRNRTER